MYLLKVVCEILIFLPIFVVYPDHLIVKQISS